MHARLRALVDAELLDCEGALVLAPLAVWLRPGMNLDVTGREAFANKFHVEDYLDSDAVVPMSEQLFCQGAKATLGLAQRLKSKERCRVFLSVDGDTATLRFFGLWTGSSWCVDDPDQYIQEAVLMIDVGLPRLADDALASDIASSERGFRSPCRGEQWVPKSPNPDWGWLDKDESVWVPTGPKPSIAHGGPPLG